MSSLDRISSKAFKAKAFDGSSDIIPASQVYGVDFGVVKSDAYWISEWILEKKSIQYSRKKEAWFDSNTKEMIPTYTIEKHCPETINPVEKNEIDERKTD